MRVWVFDVIGLEICPERFIENGDQFVEGSRLPAAQIVDAALLAPASARMRAGDDILYVNEIALLLAMLEDARPLSGSSFGATDGKSCSPARLCAPLAARKR